MTNSLLIVIQPVGEPPPPEVRERIGADLRSFHEELQAAGATSAACASSPSPTSTRR